MAEQLNKVGTWGPDGSVTTWPDVDVFGAPYDRPPNLYALSGARFVVVPQRPLKDGELEAALTPFLLEGAPEDPPPFGDFADEEG